MEFSSTFLEGYPQYPTIVGSSIKQNRIGNINIPSETTIKIPSKSAIRKQRNELNIYCKMFSLF